MRFCILLMALLGGCQGDADPLELALSGNLARQDYRLIVRAGRGEIAPGIPAEEQAEAKARCGVRYLDGLGDAIKPEQQAEYARLTAYAVDYNRRMLVHCPRRAANEE